MTQTFTPIEVGLDLSMFRRQLSGIGYYALNLIEALLRLEPDMRFSFYDGFRFRAFDRSTFEAIAARPDRPPQASGGKAGIVRRLPGARPLFRQVKRASFLRGARDLQLFHALNFFAPFDASVPVLPTVHDLSVARHPETHPAARIAWFEAHAGAVARQPLVNTISNFSASEISDVLGVAPERIRVTYPGVGPRFRVDPQPFDTAVLSTLDLETGRYFLAVGTLEPRKNLAVLLDAYAGLAPPIRRAHPLVVVGQAGWGDLKQSRLERLEAEGSLRLAGYQDDDALSALYRNAATLLFPSIYEGFGMPTLEALASGIRPVLSDIPVMREVAATAADYVAPHDVDGWRAAMKAAVETDAVTRKADRASALSRAAEFRWDDTARATAAIYRELIGD